MRYYVHIDLDDDQVGKSSGAHVAGILRKLANRVERFQFNRIKVEQPVPDGNGTHGYEGYRRQKGKP